MTGLFCVMVQEIEDHGGDVIKFAGDCLICLWRRAPNTASGALAATDASCSMRRALAATRDTDLDIHCGIARGMVKLIHVGSGDYFEFLAIGNLCSIILAQACVERNPKIVKAAAERAIAHINLNINIPQKFVHIHTASHYFVCSC